MTRTFSDGHPKVLPAFNFLSQYYFYNIFPQKSCMFSLKTLTKFEPAKTGSGVGFLRLTAVWAQYSFGSLAWPPLVSGHLDFILLQKLTLTLSQKNLWERNFGIFSVLRVWIWAKLSLVFLNQLFSKATGELWTSCNYTLCTQSACVGAFIGFSV